MRGRWSLFWFPQAQVAVRREESLTSQTSISASPHSAKCVSIVNFIISIVIAFHPCTTSAKLFLSTRHSSGLMATVKMPSSFSNFFTIFILALLTFVVLDINKNDSFERTQTAKYLSYIGAKPYIDKSIVSLKDSRLLNQYIIPNWNSLIRFLKPYWIEFRREQVRITSLVSTWFRKNTAAFLDYIEGSVVPTFKEYYNHYAVICKVQTKRIYATISEYALITGDWLSSNVFRKLPHEEIQRYLNEFVTSTQKLAFTSYEWISGHIQKMLA